MDHDDLGMVPADVKTILKDRSAKRVKDSADFAKLAKEIEQYKTRKARKSMPLNEKELREQFNKDDAEKAADKTEDLLAPDTTADKGAYHFKRNFWNNEVLQIMEDFLQGKKLVSAK